MVKVTINSVTKEGQLDSQSKSTKRLYSNDIKKFEKYCTKYMHMNALDVDDDEQSAYALVANYLFWLQKDSDAIVVKGKSEKEHYKNNNKKQNPYSNNKYRSSTIERILASLSWYYRNYDLTNKSNNPGGNIIFNRKHKQISITLKSIKKQNKTVKLLEAKALVKKDIVKIIDKIDINSEDLTDIRDKALILVGYYSFCRRSEILNLHYKDLIIEKESIILNIIYSKTDPNGEGRKVLLPKKDNRHCPVMALNQWLEIAQIKSGPLFYKIIKSNKKNDFKRIKKYQLNENSKKISLSDTSFNSILKKRAFDAGYDMENISGHSLRRGAITEARRQGHSFESIKLQSGHSTNQMISKYTEDQDIKDDNPAKDI